MVHHQKGRATNGSSSNRKTHPLIITGQEEPPINHHRTGRTTHKSSPDRKGHPRIIIGQEEPPTDHHRKGKDTHGSSPDRKNQSWTYMVHLNDKTRCYSPVIKKDCFKFGILSGHVFCLVIVYPKENLLGNDHLT
jgi:hypothetical protein